MASLLERELRDKEFARLFAQESLIAEAAELICRAMERNSVNKSDLAALAGTSKSNITQLLSGSRNMTLRTFADLMFLLNERVLVDSTRTDEFSKNTFLFDFESFARPTVQQWKISGGNASTGKAA